MKEVHVIGGLPPEGFSTPQQDDSASEDEVYSQHQPYLIVSHPVAVSGRAAQVVATTFQPVPPSESPSSSSPGQRYAFVLDGKVYDARGVEITQRPGEQIASTHVIIPCSSRSPGSTKTSQSASASSTPRLPPLARTPSGSNSAAGSAPPQDSSALRSAALAAAMKELGLSDLPAPSAQPSTSTSSVSRAPPPQLRPIRHPSARTSDSGPPRAIAMPSAPHRSSSAGREEEEDDIEGRLADQIMSQMRTVPAVPLQASTSAPVRVVRVQDDGQEDIEGDLGLRINRQGNLLKPLPGASRNDPILPRGAQSGASASKAGTSAAQSRSPAAAVATSANHASAVPSHAGVVASSANSGSQRSGMTAGGASVNAAPASSQRSQPQAKAVPQQAVTKRSATQGSPAKGSVRDNKAANKAPGGRTKDLDFQKMQDNWDALN